MSVKKILTFFGWPLLVLPAALLYLGIALNGVATISNGGFMPVRHADCTEEGSWDGVHICMTPESHAKFLVDVLTQNAGIFSVGDECMAIGREIKSPAYLLWGTILCVCLIRREKFYLE